MKIYFAGSISGGRERVEDFKKIIYALQKKHTVFTEQLTVVKAMPEGDKSFVKEMFDRGLVWIKDSDVLVADVSIPSVGVGWEIGFVESLGKRVICLYNVNSEKKLSTTVEGNPKNEIIKYNSVDEVIEKLNKLLG